MVDRLESIQRIGHRLTRQLEALIMMDKRKRATIAHLAGINRYHLAKLRRSNVSLRLYEAVLEVLGYRLKIVRMNAPDYDEPLCGPGIIGLKPLRLPVDQDYEYIPAFLPRR